MGQTLKRFMIVSKERSGTNHFVSLLKSHPQIACFGEVFRDGYNVPKLIANDFTHYAQIDTRTTDPNRFLDDLEDFVKSNSYRKSASQEHDAPYVNSDVEVLGFKIFPQQLLPVTQITRRAGMRVIRLVRPNILATYSSDRIARLTGQGAVGINQQVQRAKLDFRARDFKRFTSSQASMDDDVNKALEIIPQDRVFNMEYTDLGSETVLEKLLEFLGVEPYPMTSVAQAQSFADYRTLQ